MKLQTVFTTGLGIWLLGGAVAALTGNALVRLLAVDIVGILTLALGLFLFARWGWKKLSLDDFGKTETEEHVAERPRVFSRVRKPIYSMRAVPDAARDIIERAVQNQNFKPKGTTPEGWEIVLIQTPTQDWLAVIEAKDAIVITAAYRASTDGLDQQIQDLTSG